MKLKLVPGITFSAMAEAVSNALPMYEVRLLKNPLLRFEYLQIRKSAFIGVWVRIHEKKNMIQLIGCIPSTFARMMFGGIIVLLFLRSAQGKVIAEVKTVLERTFNTSELK